MRDNNDEIIQINDHSLAEPPENYNGAMGFSSPTAASFFDDLQPIDEAELNQPIQSVQNEFTNHFEAIEETVSVSDDVLPSEDETLENSIENVEADNDHVKETTENLENSDAQDPLSMEELDTQANELLERIMKPYLQKMVVKSDGTLELSPDDLQALMLSTMNECKRISEEQIKNQNINKAQQNAPLNQQQVGMVPSGQAQQLTQSLMSIANGAVKATASVSNLMTDGIRVTAEGGRNLLNKYINNHSIEVKGKSNQLTLDADPIVATTQMRQEKLLEAQNTYQQEMQNFWQHDSMKDVKNKIKKLANEQGLSEQDVMARINSNDHEFKEITKDFNEAFEQSDGAKKSKLKMDKALNTWRENHDRLNKAALHLQTQDHPQGKDTFDLLTDSEKTMVQQTTEIPKTPNETQSNLEKMQEHLKHVKEMMRLFAEKISNMFKGNNNESSAPRPN